MVVGIADEAQSTFVHRSTVREILHVLQELVEGAFHLGDLVVPSFEHLSVGEVRLSNETSILIVDLVDRPLLWETVHQFLKFVGSASGQILHDSKGDHDLFAMLFVGARFVPVEEPLIGLGRTDTREYHGFTDACASDLICIWILFVRVRELLCVVSSREQASRVANRWRNDQCSTGSDECNPESGGLHFGFEVEGSKMR